MIAALELAFLLSACNNSKSFKVYYQNPDGSVVPLGEKSMDSSLLEIDIENRAKKIAESREASAELNSVIVAEASPSKAAPSRLNQNLQISKSGLLAEITAVVNDVNQLNLDTIKILETPLDERASIDIRLSKLSKCFDSILSDVAAIEKRLSSLEGSVGAVKTNVESKSKSDLLRNKYDEISKTLDACLKKLGSAREQTKTIPKQIDELKSNFPDWLTLYQETELLLGKAESNKLIAKKMSDKSRDLGGRLKHVEPFNAAMVKKQDSAGVNEERKLPALTKFAPKNNTPDEISRELKAWLDSIESRIDTYLYNASISKTPVEWLSRLQEDLKADKLFSQRKDIEAKIDSTLKVLQGKYDDYINKCKSETGNEYTILANKLGPIIETVKTDRNRIDTINKKTPQLASELTHMIEYWKLFSAVHGTDAANNDLRCIVSDKIKRTENK